MDKAYREIMMKSCKLLLPTLLILFSFGAFGMEESCVSEEQLIEEWTPEIPCEIASDVMHKNPIVDYICGFVPFASYCLVKPIPTYDLANPNFRFPFCDANQMARYAEVSEGFGQCRRSFWDMLTREQVQVRCDTPVLNHSLNHSKFGLAMEKFLGPNPSEKIEKCVGFQGGKDTIIQITDTIFIAFARSSTGKVRGYDISKVPLEDRERVKDYLNNKLTLKQANLLYAIGKSIEKGEQFHLDADKERARDLMATYCSLDSAVEKVLKDHVAINGAFKDTFLPKNEEN